MQDFQEIIPIDGMDLDTELLHLKQGAALKTLNVRHLTDKGGTTQAIEPAKGNKFAYVIPPLTVQDKTYRFRNFTGTSVEFRLTIRRPNGTILVIKDLSYTAQTPTEFRTVLISELSGYIGLDFTITKGSDYVDLELRVSGVVAGFDYTLSTDSATVETILIKEAIPYSLAGEMITIGSYDLMGNIFIWSTPQAELPSDLSVVISGMTGNDEVLTITTNNAHGLSAGQEIIITNSTLTTFDGANGSSIIISIPSSTTFVIPNTSGEFFTAGFIFNPDSNISINNISVGEVGVAQHDINNDLWTYTRLLRCRDWNFRTIKQIDSHVEANNVQYSLYWCDGFNLNRVMYYSGTFATDGAIEEINSNGQYGYETVSDETRLILSNTDINLSFVQQLQSGGGVKSGNWRYAIRLLSESLTPTDLSDLTNPISAYTAGTGNSKAIFGDAAGETTTKRNEFLVTGIKIGLFKYIELIGINYVGITSEPAVIIRREIISGETMTLFHTGLETATAFSTEEVLKKNVSYLTARNITAIDNRLVLSNLTIAQQKDLSAWVETFTYEIKIKQLSAVRDVVKNNLRFGEYQDPHNVHNYMGYMHNETYRFGIKVKFKTGGESQAFWFRDITIDGVPGHLTSLNSADLYIPYVELSNINLDYLIDGVKARDLIDEIVPMRVEMTEQTIEVLATGMVALAVKNAFNANGSPTTTRQYFPPQAIGEYYYISGQSTPDALLAQAPQYPYEFTPKRRYGTFYSPDMIWGSQSISYKSGDQIFNYGPGAPKYENTGDVIGTFQNLYGEYNGYFGLGYTKIFVSDIKKIFKGLTETIGGQLYSTVLAYIVDLTHPTWDAVTYNTSALILKVDTDLVPPSSNFNEEKGFYYCQYFRDKGGGDKFEDKKNSTYIPTGAYYKVTNASPQIVNELAVFGGDVFTQKTYIKHRYYARGTENGNGGGVAFYSQNRINTQMRTKESTANLNFPESDLLNWLESTDQTDYPYNVGYNPTNEIEVNIAFDPNLQYQNNLPVRLIWSQLKPQGSLVDFYRNFTVGDEHDLDVSFGEIIHTANGNGELITWQLRKFMRQYFNTRGILTASDGTEIIISDGSVMDRDGQTLTVYGCQNKWSIIKGKSAQGSDVFYWINVELKKAIRFGYDGTISLADLRGLRSFFANGLDWVKGKDTPAHGEGIHGVFDDRFSDVVWTVMGERILQKREHLGAGMEDQIIFYEVDTRIKDSLTSAIYEAKEGATSHNFHLPDYWTLIIPDRDDMRYYNEYTIAFNEIKNKFTTFFSFLPKIYIKWADTFLSPKNGTGRAYRHNEGEYCSWYDSAVEEDAYIEGVVNKHRSESKFYISLRATSEIKPERMDFITKNHISYVTSSDFETTEDKHDSAIKNDSTDTGENDGDTSQLWGHYLRVKMTFKKKVYQKLVGLIVKFRVSARVSTK